MTARKNQHFVPKFYFRRFSKDGRSICALTRHTGQVIVQASIKGQASKDWFYGTVKAENELCEIEGHCGAALRELSTLRDPSELSSDYVDWVLVHLVLQRSRTEAARQTSAPMHNKIAQLISEVVANNVEEVTGEQREQLLEAAFSVAADPVETQKLDMVIAMQLASSLRDLQPLLLLNKTNRPFIFGDSPVVFYNAYSRDVKLRGVLGYSSPGLLVYTPLSSDLALLLADSEVYRLRCTPNNRVLIRDLNDVAALNKLQLHAASSCVYFSEACFAGYVKALLTAERGRLTKHMGAVVQAPGRNAHTGETLGEILHCFQPQIEYHPKLTFLKHDVLGDSDNLRIRRIAARQFWR